MPAPIAAGTPVPVDFLDVGSLRLIPAGSRVSEGVVEPAFIDDAHDTIQFLVVVAVGVDQRTPGLPFQRRIGREDESSGSQSHCRHFVDEDIGWAASPTLVRMEGPAGLLKAYFLDELVGALNKRLNIPRCEQSAGVDGVIRARHGFIGAKSLRRGA